VSKRPVWHLDVTAAARRDIAGILRRSLQEFGGAAAKRYDRLIKQALHDIAADPQRPGTKQRPELPGVFLYHLTVSRDRLASETVKAPRHFVVYRVTGELVEVLRLLHDSRDLARHLSG
jgi:toxin ParE1/3/4